MLTFDGGARNDNDRDWDMGDGDMDSFRGNDDAQDEDWRNQPIAYRPSSHRKLRYANQK